MTTVTATYQGLIDKINALVTDANFVKDNATMTALLANAATQLGTGAGFEAQILANIQVILNSFATQGTTQTATLTAAKNAVDTATAALNAQAATVNTLLNRKPLARAMSIGLKSLLLSGPANQALSGYNYQLSVMPSLYDKRPTGGKLLTASFSQGLGVYNANGSTTVRSHAAGVHTTLRQSGGTNQPNGKFEFFLPLAKSAADATTKASYVRFGTVGYDGYSYTYYWSGGYISNEDAWTTDTAISTANSPRIAWMAYDKTNKTLVYLPYNSQGNQDTTGQPPSNNPVFELFANGTVRTVTGVTGWAAYLAYVLGTPSRFIILTMNPQLTASTTTWSANYNSYTFPRLRCAGTLTPQVAYYPLNVTDSSSAGFQTALNLSHDGAYSWGACCSFDTARSHNLATTSPENNYTFDATGFDYHDMHQGGSKAPMWVIESDGSVNVYWIHYQPDFSPEYAYDANYPERYNVWNGYDFVVMDHTGAILAQGYAPVDAKLRVLGSDASFAGRSIGQCFPLGFHLTDNVLQSFIGIGCKRNGSSKTVAFPTYGSYSFLTYQKLVGG